MNPTELQALASAQGITLDPLLLVDYPVGTWFWAIHHEVVDDGTTGHLYITLHVGGVLTRIQIV